MTATLKQYEAVKFSKIYSLGAARGDLVVTNVGRALWSDGGPSRAFQFYEVSDERVPGLACPGYK